MITAELNYMRDLCDNNQIDLLRLQVKRIENFRNTYKNLVQKIIWDTSKTMEDYEEAVETYMEIDSIYRCIEKNLILN